MLNSSNMQANKIWKNTHIVHWKVWMTSNSKLAYVGLISIAEIDSCGEDSATRALSSVGENWWSLKDTLWSEGEARALVGEALPMGEALRSEGEALPTGEALSVSNALWPVGEALSMHKALWSVEASSVEVLKFGNWYVDWIGEKNDHHLTAISLDEEEKGKKRKKRRRRNQEKNMFTHIQNGNTKLSLLLLLPTWVKVCRVWQRSSCRCLKM